MKMSKKEIKAVLLRRRGFKIREIAALLEVSERTVKRWLKKSRECNPALLDYFVRSIMPT